jgi:hypothetical protein
MQSKPIILRPIGFVRSPVAKVADDCWGGVVATWSSTGNSSPGIDFRPD